MIRQPLPGFRTARGDISGTTKVVLGCDGGLAAVLQWSFCRFWGRTPTAGQTFRCPTRRS